MSALVKSAPAAPSGETDHWFTKLALWQPWNEEARYTVDIAGHPEAPVSLAIGRWYDIHTNGLVQDLLGERVWCNPPFSDIPPWVELLHRSMRDGCGLADMLVPANRTEQAWWQEFVEPYRDRGQIDGITLASRFLRRRERFGFPGDVTGESGHQPRFGLVRLSWRLA